VNDKRIIMPPGFDVGPRPIRAADFTTVNVARVELGTARVLAAVSAAPIRKDEAVSAFMSAILTLLEEMAARSEVGWQCARVFARELETTGKRMVACESRQAFAEWVQARHSRDVFEHGPAATDEAPR